MQNGKTLWEVFNGELPYAGTSGWSGSDTSRERAEIMDSTGRTKELQEEVLAWIAYSAGSGLTWKDIAATLNIHHGSASGVLSVLHKAGRISRLAEVRNRCKVYVLPDYVNGRLTETQGRKDTYFKVSYESINDRYPSFTRKDWLAFVEAVGEYVDEYLIGFNND